METQLQIYKLPQGNRAVTEFTMPKIFQLAFNSSFLPETIKISRFVINNSKANIYSSKEKADALFFWIKNNFQYFPDPSTVEHIKAPRYFFKDGFGDCDDFVTTLLALNMACGNVGRVAAIARKDAKRLDHVYLEIKVGDSWICYDPIVPWSYPGWRPKRVAEAFFENGHYFGVGGFFDSIFDELKRFVKRIEQDIISRTFRELQRFGKKMVPKPIYEELKRFESSIRNEVKRVARDFRDEIRRVNERIAKEFARWEREMGIFGKFLVVGIKGLMLSSPGLFIATQFGSFDAFKMNTDEWLLLAKLGLTIASLVVSIVTAGSASGLLISSVMELVNSAVSVIEMDRALDARKEVIAQLKEIKAQADIEIRLKKEAIAKLENQVIAIERIKQKKLDYQKRIELMQLEHQKHIHSLLAA